MTTTQELLNKLKAQGLSKYKIAHIIGVSWNALHMWDRGVFEATEQHQVKLNKLVNDKAAVIKQ